jgi:hypothetical protein
LSFIAWLVLLMFVSCSPLVDETVMTKDSFFVANKVRGYVYRGSKLQQEFFVKKVEQREQGRIVVGAFKIIELERKLEAFQAEVVGSGLLLGGGKKFVAKKIFYSGGARFFYKTSVVHSLSGECDLLKQEVISKERSVFRKGLVVINSLEGFLYKTKSKELYLNGEVKGRRDYER